MNFTPKLHTKFPSPPLPLANWPVKLPLSLPGGFSSQGGTHQHDAKTHHESLKELDRLCHQLVMDLGGGLGRLGPAEKGQPNLGLLGISFFFTKNVETMENCHRDINGDHGNMMVDPLVINHG